MSGASGGWESRPILAGVVRLVAHAVPIGVSVAAAVVVSRALPRPDGTAAVVAWWVGITAVSTVVLVLTDRLSRRLLPLAALLKLSLLFPDRTPSRFGVALRSG